MLTRRRAMLAAPLATQATAAGAGVQDAEFPPALTMAGRGLVLNGTGSRRYLGVEVYRAALYLERRGSDEAAILDSPGAKLVVLRYRRDVPLSAIERAWETSFAETCRCPVPETFRAWWRPIRAGDTERYLILPAAAELAANAEPAVRIPGAATARILLATFIGPAAPTAALRRGLLGQG